MSPVAVRMNWKREEKCRETNLGDCAKIHMKRNSEVKVPAEVMEKEDGISEITREEESSGFQVFSE